MPSLIVLGVINQNTPQENAGTFVGEGNFGGWDANMKINQGHGGYYGAFNITPLWVNINVDNLELVDGAIADQDVKPTMSFDV
ncbi:hypothetical protein GCM10010885_19780 [Alicyclobacillus cellulosilyticus]|uniref:Uncharacterized protein n=1 Tax=Alicyclobacillus cellulosilyticus TaxID=1003997 RepID=A0A917KDZ8_9BACL|nr:hypothetical protein [Alicyclobacillus cellulosilyticus]GGJ10623.1 hypothetical protein GCM10010885_19780 [Alicyclobacillus cellulosilyticus]